MLTEWFDVGEGALDGLLRQVQDAVPGKPNPVARHPLPVAIVHVEHVILVPRPRAEDAGTVPPGVRQISCDQIKPNAPILRLLATACGSRDKEGS